LTVLHLALEAVRSLDQAPRPVPTTTFLVLSPGVVRLRLPPIPLVRVGYGGGHPPIVLGVALMLLGGSGKSAPGRKPL
jgi:hypothetical protein